MRWLLISSQHHPSHGGVGTYVSRFVRGATQAGWTIDLITRPGSSHPQGATIHELTTPDMDVQFVERLPTLRRIEKVRPYRYALWSLAVAKFLSSWRTPVDVVEFVDVQAEGYASLCTSQIRRTFRDVPMLVHAHTPMFVEEHINQCDPARFGRSLYHQWERAALQACDGIIVTSRLLGAWMPPSIPLAVIPYPIEEESVIDRDDRAETIVLVGSVQPRKGVETWMRSLNEVFRRRPNARAMLIGPDTATAASGRSMMASLSPLIQPEYRPRFKWLGAIPHDQVKKQVATAAILVVPSVFESFSFAAAEALTFHTPVIVSDQVGIGEHVPGLRVCPAHDVEAWTTAQVDVLANNQRAIQSTANLRAQLFESCSPQRHLRLRADFVNSLHAALDGKNCSDKESSASDELIRFLEDVNAEERAESCCSSVGS